ncbi:MAG TPA: bis(5'-nucleosyl)-tetraphosphatase (symmetrical) YqeK [Bacillota bacterium]|nr:bis(5'-nucleosyl)-tetraphosphatase (symmetrical) YqeK [Bacillota bacterium]
MDREELLKRVQEQMPEHRFTHTQGVASTAVRLANQYGANEDDAELAGILHDYCKYWNKEKMQEIIEQTNSIPKDLLLFDKELWHAPVAACVAEKELGIYNPDVLSAIRFHTSGRTGMSLLEKIVWLSDYIEPGRIFPGVEEVRLLAEQNLDQALIKAFGNTISFLAKQGKKIYPLTLEAYNDLVQQVKLKGEEVSDGF